MLNFNLSSTGKCFPSFVLCLLLALPANADERGVYALQKGVQLFGSNKNKESLVFLNRAVIDLPQEPFALLARSETLLKLNRPKEALINLQQALKFSRYKGGTHSRLGLCYLEMHQPALAEKELELAIRLNELDILRWASWLDYLNLSAAKQNLGKFKEANALRLLGNRLRKQQQVRETREALDMPASLVQAEAAVQVKPDDTYSHYLRGLLRLNAGQPAKAVDDFSVVIAKQGQDPLPHYFRADAYLDSGKLTKAIDDYSKIIALAPPIVAIVDVAETGRCKSSAEGYDESAIVMSDIFYLRACAYRRLGKLKEAKQDLAVCLKKSPSDLEAKILNLDFLIADGRKTAALEKMQRLINENPSDTHCLQLAASFYTRQGLLDKALSTSNLLIRTTRGETNALLCRAKIFEKLGKWTDSVRDYTDALKNDDFNDEALLGRARAYSHIGDWRSAIADCDKALKYTTAPKTELQQLKLAALAHLSKNGSRQ